MFDSKYFLIINYPRGTSGKFLANCLGLSDGVILQDKTLTNLTSDEKLSLLLTRLKQVKNIWTDLDLGDYELFGKGTYKHSDPDCYPNEVKQALNNNKYVIRINHNPYHTSNLLSTWKNAKVIDFVDTDNYLEHRKSMVPVSLEDHLAEYWNNIKGPDWPSNPPEYFEDIAHLPVFIRKELNELFYDGIVGLMKNKKPIPKSSITWNPTWFLDKNIFLEKVYNLYNTLNLRDFNKDAISIFYNEYIKVARITVKN